MRRALAFGLSVAALAGCGTDEEESASPAPREPAQVAVLVCGEDGPELRTPVTVGHADGVHIRVRNENDYEVEFDYEVTRGDTGGGGATVPPGTSVQVVPFAAKEVSIGCAAEALDRVELEVVDTGGALKSADLECDERKADLVDPKDDLRGRDPIALTRRYLRDKGLRPNDVLERAVPIAGEIPVVRVVRSGRVVAAVRLDNAVPLHTIGSVETCADFAAAP